MEKNATKAQLEKLKAQVQLISENLKNQDSPTAVACGPRNPSGEYSFNAATFAGFALNF